MIRKILYSVFVNATILSVLAFAAFGFSQVYTWFNTGADRSQILLLESDQISSVYQPAVRWLDNDQQEGRPLEDATIRKIMTDYIAGCYYLGRAALNQQTEGLNDYFTEDYRKPLIRAVNNYESLGQTVRGTTISHTISPNFYTADGTLMTLTDTVISYHEVSMGERKVTYYDTAKYDVMLLLEDNYWRVRHKVRSEIISESDENEINAQKHYKIRKGRFTESGKAFRLKCLNYYPAETPWQTMWEQYDHKAIRKDFKELENMGFNSVRIFVPYETFGKSEVDKAMLAKLRSTLDLAEKHHLKVIVTLFDFFLGYQLQEWTLSDRHIDQLISQVKDHPAIFAWDIKNEPDLDFDSVGKDEVIAWLDFILKRIKNLDPDHFVTIGWSQPEVSSELAESVDFVSFHFYRSPDELSAYLEKNSGIDKPYFAGETGMHSYNSWWFPFGKSQQEQADYANEVLTILQRHYISYGIWTLYDFKKVPSNVAGSAPWKKKPQQKYGLIDIEGNKKSIYNTVLNFNRNGK